MWGFISTVTASTSESPADILEATVCFSDVGRRGLDDVKHASTVGMIQAAEVGGK